MLPDEGVAGQAEGLDHRDAVSVEVDEHVLAALEPDPVVPVHLDRLDPGRLPGELLAQPEIRDGQLAVLGEGDAIRLRGGKGRLLLLAGEPLRERVAHYGPFVMNSDEEILQAVRDFQSGRMGEITRTARVE